MKLILIGLVSVAIVMGGFFAFNAYMYQEKQTDITLDPTPQSDTNTLSEEGLFVPPVVREVPTAGKLDPKVACESALAYMTFSTGEEAEKFVESCMAGDHPEVIERYRDSLDVDNAAI